MRIGLGCMRLSTAADRDDVRGVQVVRAALDAGATLLDTADAYCHDERDTGHNERLIAEALRGWTGDRSTITVATKGGLVRTKGAWVNDGRAKHLRAACDASRRALGVDVIDLYQLHAVDPKTSIETSVRALAALQKEGAIRGIGLCNVTVGQIESARRIAEIATIQVKLSPFDDENLRNGVAEYCRDHDIPVIAYRPLGGDRVARLSRHPDLADIASAHGATSPEVALAWLGTFPGVIPIPGATTVASASSIGQALALSLGGDEVARLDAAFSGRLLRAPRAARRPPVAAAEVVVVMGIPGAGKTTLTGDLERDGYLRLNRDEIGGSLADLVPLLGDALARGTTRVVLDNTYPSRVARNRVIECAWEHGAHVRCIWLDTGMGDAQVNAIRRMLAANDGRLPTPEEIKERGKGDPRFLAPTALFSFERSLEPPTEDEGFETVEVRRFERSRSAGGPRGLVVDLDETLADEGLASTVRARRAEGQRVLALAWRPGTDVAGSRPDAFSAARAALGDVDVGCCPHAAGPPICWCRKPIPGLVIEFAEREGIALHDIVVVGRSAADRTMAERLGATYMTGLEPTVSSG